MARGGGNSMMIILLLICCCVSSIIAGGVGYFITQEPEVEEKEEEEEEEEFDYKASEPETVAPEVVTVTPTFTAEETTPTVTARVLEKVDCVYSGWTNQGTCSNGKQKQTRTIKTQPKYGGTACDNSSLEREVSCGQNCVGAYGNWTACTKVCGGGKRTRLYSVGTPASGGGVPCPTDQIDVACNTQACPKYQKQNAMYYKSPSVYVNPTTGATTLNIEEAKISTNSNKDCLNACTKHSNCGGFYHNEISKHCTLYKSASGTRTAYMIGFTKDTMKDVYKKVGSSGMPDLVGSVSNKVYDVDYDGKA
jgi:hypothetical protein